MLCSHKLGPGRLAHGLWHSSHSSQTGDQGNCIRLLSQSLATSSCLAFISCKSLYCKRNSGPNSKVAFVSKWHAHFILDHGTKSRMKHSEQQIDTGKLHYRLAFMLLLLMFKPQFFQFSLDLTTLRLMININ